MAPFGKSQLSGMAPKPNMALATIDQGALLLLFTETDARDKIGALAQQVCRLAFGLALLLASPARAKFCRRLMVAVSDARRTFRWITCFALRKALVLRTISGDKIGTAIQLCMVDGLLYDGRAWLRQHGVLSDHLYASNVKSADFRVGLSNAIALVRNSQVLHGSRSGLAMSARLVLRELMLLVQYLHDVSPALSARRQILVGLCGILTNFQDIQDLAARANGAARLRREQGCERDQQRQSAKAATAAAAAVTEELHAEPHALSASRQAERRTIVAPPTMRNTPRVLSAKEDDSCSVSAASACTDAGYVTADDLAEEPSWLQEAAEAVPEAGWSAGEPQPPLPTTPPEEPAPLIAAAVDADGPLAPSSDDVESVVSSQARRRVST